MTTMTISEFLLARIAEDEQSITELTRRMAPRGYQLYEQFGDFGDDERWMIEIPAGRLAAECEAKRRIVGLHPEILTICQECANESYPCRTLTTLALPYAEHQDYNQDWRP